MYIYIYIYIHNHVRLSIERILTCMHACIHTYIPTYLRTYIHAYMHTYIYMHAHTHTYLYIYIYACSTGRDTLVYVPACEQLHARGQVCCGLHRGFFSQQLQLHEHKLHHKKHKKCLPATPGNSYHGGNSSSVQHELHSVTQAFPNHCFLLGNSNQDSSRRREYSS